MKLGSIVVLFVGCTFAARGGTSATAGGGTSGESAPPPSPEVAAGGGEVPAASDGWTLEEREFWKKLQEELDEFAKRTNNQCRSQIAASYQKEAFRGKLTAGGSYGLPQDIRARCTAMLNAIVDVCGYGDAAKQAVAAKVRHVTCDWGQPASYALRDGTFHARINTDSDQVSTYQRAAEAVLKKSL